MKALDRADIRSSNEMSMTIEIDSKDKVVAGVESKRDNRVFYRLDLLILVDNYAKNLFSYNFTNILANFFSNLSSTSIDFYSFLSFPIFFVYSAAFNSTNNPKPFDSISLTRPAICNLDNIILFYHLLFTLFQLILLIFFLI